MNNEIYTTNRSFVCAALPSVIQHVSTMDKYHPGYMEYDKINSFMLGECNKYLSSVGVAINKGKPIDNNIFKRYQKMFDGFLSKPFMKDIEIIIDSAGFQFQTGLIPTGDVPKFVKMYHEFLEKNVDNFKFAFLFDPVPGATQSIVKSYEQMEELNVLSFEEASKLSQEVRDKMLYIHHFRTPKINELYKKMMFELNLSDNFTNFATGGLVAFSRSGVGNPPCVMYVVPLVSILTKAIERGLKKFRFHVLGATEFKDILFHKFIEHHVKKLYDIELEITYDSSTIFKTLMMGRYLYVPDPIDYTIWKMSLRSDALHMDFRNRGTAEDYFYTLLNEMSESYGFKNLSQKNEPIYEIIDGKQRITRIMYTYGIFFILKLFNLCGIWCSDIVSKLYPLYESGQIYEFDNSIEKQLFKFNNGKMTKVIKSRTSTFYNSLKMLENLDLEYCDHLIDSYMSCDEPEELQGFSTRF